MKSRRPRNSILGRCRWQCAAAMRLVVLEAYPGHWRRGGICWLMFAGLRKEGAICFVIEPLWEGVTSRLKNQGVRA